MGLRQSKEVRRSEPSKIEKQMVQAMAERAQSGRYGMKAFNSIIMKFPKIDESFEAVRTVFKNFGMHKPSLQVKYCLFRNDCIAYCSYSFAWASNSLCQRNWMISLVQLYLSSNASTMADATKVHQCLCVVSALT